MRVPKIPVWLDCDPGHDDAFAILLAAYHPQLQLLGISTVFGNASLRKTTNNAASILTAIGKEKEITVYPGAHKPLVRPERQHAVDIHGESGIDGTDHLPEGRAQVDTTTGAVHAMAEALLNSPPGTAWLVATGSLTNVGALLQEYPQIVGHLAGLSIMGGAIGGGFSSAVMGMVDGVARVGNWSQYAEFNIFIDPEAAALVFGNEELAAKTTLVPLDLTHQALATKKVRTMLLHGKGAPAESPDGEGKSTLRTMLVELLFFFAKTYEDVFGITEGPPLHDPLAVAAILSDARPGIPFQDWSADGGPEKRERFDVTVVTEGNFEDAAKGSQLGRTIATLKEPGKPGVRIPRSLDLDSFWDEIEACIERAEAVVAKRA